MHDACPHDFGDLLSQPASAVARKQAKRSEKTALSGTTLCLAQTLYGFACKSTNSIHLDLNRPIFVVQLYDHDKRNLVFRPRPALLALSSPPN
jgi:hypothetical protein